jgi:uncharacterized protein YndB with AHSA1/START domain
MTNREESLTCTVAIAAAAEAVWEALTDGEKVTRWFAPEAAVTPGEGGRIRLSWGPGMEGEAPITGWEPGRRLAWTERGGSESEVEVEFRLEPGEAGKTLVRLRQTGSVTAAAGNGWQCFLRLLQLDLESHWGKAARHVWRLEGVEAEPGAVMEQVLGALAFAREGEQFRGRLAEGMEIAGSVLVEPAAGYLVLRLEGEIEGALGLFAEDGGGKTWLTTSWYLKGEAAGRAEAIGSAWAARYPTEFVQSD